MVRVMERILLRILPIILPASHLVIFFHFSLSIALFCQKRNCIFIVSTAFSLFNRSSVLCSELIFLSLMYSMTMNCLSFIIYSKIVCVTKLLSCRFFERIGKNYFAQKSTSSQCIVCGYHCFQTISSKHRQREWKKLQDGNAKKTC